jgi:hypothetical protein
LKIHFKEKWVIKLNFDVKNKRGEVKAPSPF